MLVDITPYVLGAMISPVVLAVSVVLLAQKQKPLLQSGIFFLGGLLAAIPVGALVFYAAHARTQASRPTLTDTAIHLVIGLVLLYLAIRAWRKPTTKQHKVGTKVHYGRDFVLGMVLVASDITSLIMFVPAGLVLQTAPGDVRLAGLALLIMALTMAMWLPLLIVILLGERGKRLLAKASSFMSKHGQQVTAVIVGAIAVFELVKGFRGL